MCFRNYKSLQKETLQLDSELAHRLFSIKIPSHLFGAASFLAVGPFTPVGWTQPWYSHLFSFVIWSIPSSLIILKLLKQKKKTKQPPKQVNKQQNKQETHTQKGLPSPQIQTQLEESCFNLLPFQKAPETTLSWNHTGRTTKSDTTGYFVSTL